MDKHKVVYLHSGILFSYKMEGKSDICYMVNLEHIMLRGIKQSQKDKYYHL